MRKFYVGTLRIGKSGMPAFQNMELSLEDDEKLTFSALQEIEEDIMKEKGVPGVVLSVVPLEE